MSIDRNAFFYDDRYFLLPDDCADTEELLQKHGDGKPFPVTELKEKKCLAPYFVAEHAKEKQLKLKKDLPVFPCRVEVMTMAAYNQRLREIIPGHCQGCPNFGAIDEKDSSLKGHHEEIALNDVCFFRNEAECDTGDYRYITTWMETFVSRFGTLGLEALIDEGKTDEAIDVLCQALYDTIFERVPLVFIDKNENGKYRLVFTAFLDADDALLMECLFNLLEKKYKKNWVFISGLPQGYTTPGNSLPQPIKPLGICYTLDEECYGTGLELTIYAGEDQATEAYLWMTRQYGEARLHTACCRLTVESIGNQPLPDGVTDADSAQLEQAIVASLAKANTEILYPAAHIALFVPSSVAEDTPEEEVAPLMALMSTRSPVLQRRLVYPLLDGAIPEDVWTAEDRSDSEGDDARDTRPNLAMLSCPIARLVFTDVPPLHITGESSGDSNCEKNQQDFSNALAAVSKALGERHLWKSFSQNVFLNGRMEFYGVVLHLRNFMYAMRRMAPVFAQHSAELYVYTASHTSGGHFKLDYDMKLLENETSLWNKQG